ncbi:pollen Ole e 1 allergen and extensin family protein [Tanacetum coccineum]
MAMKSMLLVTLLVVVFAAPQATQGVKMAIRGTVYCSADGNMVASALTATPPYANALVQVSCLGHVVSLATTNSNGGFQADLDLPLNITRVLSQCGMAIVTPVMIGDPSQPTLGYLQSRLQWHKTTTRENQDVAEFSPLGFKLIKM